jgi:hypothetical protein
MPIAAAVQTPEALVVREFAIGFVDEFVDRGTRRGVFLFVRLGTALVWPSTGWNCRQQGDSKEPYGCRKRALTFEWHADFSFGRMMPTGIAVKTLEQSWLSLRPHCRPHSERAKHSPNRLKQVLPLGQQQQESIAVVPKQFLQPHMQDCPGAHC